MIGYAFCGSFCTLSASLSALRGLLAEGLAVQPIMSAATYETDTRFYPAAALREEVETLCGRPIIHTIVEAEPLGPKTPLDFLIIAPCTGNTLAKMAHGITDTAVTMAAKAHMRTGRPMLLALATNDAMSANLQNLAALSLRKGVYFVPLRQDDPVAKPASLVADFTRVGEAYRAAKQGVQLRPLFL
ncbi:MAG: dipicolinate synthase subunit B [Clostridia bacterium]|nr:dipicolinate synthase subunit B [Clostridia bacterium]